MAQFFARFYGNKKKSALEVCKSISCGHFFLVCFIGIAIDGLFGLSALRNNSQKKALDSFDPLRSRSESRNECTFVTHIAVEKSLLRLSFSEQAFWGGSQMMFYDLRIF